MINLVKIISTFLFAAILLLGLARPAKAEPYGEITPRPEKSIIVDKKVGKHGTEETYSDDWFVDNFSVNDRRFRPGETVVFRVKIKNTSTVTLRNVVFKDVLPPYVEAARGPGSYDEDTRTITHTIEQIAAGDTIVYDIVVRVKDRDDLPSNRSVICVDNRAEAGNDDVFDDDRSQFCIGIDRGDDDGRDDETRDDDDRFEEDVQGETTDERKPRIIGPIIEIPKTGPPLGLALLGGNVLAVGVGLLLRGTKRKETR